MKNKNDLAYWVALNHVSGIGPVTFKQLLQQFGTAKEVWEARESQLKAAKVFQAVIAELSNARETVSPPALLEKILSTQITPITLVHPSYPNLLKEIYDPPPVLYTLGELKPEDAKAIAVIGTRKMTSYGKIVTEKLVTGLVEQGFTIVSGLARGVDATAHKAALAANGRTISVLGGGLWNLYPPEHKALAQEITKHGAVISEFPPSLPAVPGNFPARNRIISGLSLGVLVTEAQEKSGTMITVTEALDQNREVFAVPGPITSSFSVGTMKLIKEGAKLVTSVADILEELQLPSSSQISPITKITHITPASKEEAVILQLLENEPQHTDYIVRHSNMSSAAVLSTLSVMELTGRLKEVESNVWAIA